MSSKQLQTGVVRIGPAFVQCSRHCGRKAGESDAGRRRRPQQNDACFSSTWTTMSKYETTGSLKKLLEFAVDEFQRKLHHNR